MQAGRLRDRVVVQNLTTSRDPSGQPVEAWHDGAERFRSDITAASRLRVMTGAFKGAILNIIGPPIPDSRGVQLEILCKQGTEK